MAENKVNKHERHVEECKQIQIWKLRHLLLVEKITYYLIKSTADHLPMQIRNFAPCLCVKVICAASKLTQCCQIILSQINVVFCIFDNGVEQFVSFEFVLL